MVSSNHGDHGWSLDTGCSFHLCPDKSLFKHYERVHGGHVLLGNDKACPIVGKGIVLLHLSSGNEFQFQVNDVRHVQELKRNLVSLGSLDKSSV